MVSRSRPWPGKCAVCRFGHESTPQKSNEKSSRNVFFFGDSAIFLIAWKSSLVPFGDVRRRSQDCVYDSEVNLLRVDEPVLSIVIIFNRAPAF